MAFSAAKGTVLKMTIGTVLTTIAQVIDLDGPEGKTGVFECDTLDNANAAVPRKNTGSSISGPVTGNLFFDPVGATHQAFTDLLTTPATTACSIVWSDAATTSWPFSAEGFSFSPSAALGDGLKASFSIEPDGLVTYPT